MERGNATLSNVGGGVARPLVPLARPLILGGVEVRFPLELPFDWLAGAMLSSARSRVSPLLRPPLRPVPAGRHGGSVLVTAAHWTDSPVGPFHEVTMWAPVYVGRGSPVPGLAALLHARFDRTESVGRYGYHPLWSLVDREDAVGFRAEVWRVPTRTVTIRSDGDRDRRVVQVDAYDDPVLRLHVEAPSAAGPGRLSVPIYGRGEASPWADYGDVHADRLSVRGGDEGSLDLYAAGPLTELAVMLGATATDPVRTGSFALLLAGDGRVRFAGPRALER